MSDDNNGKTTVILRCPLCKNVHSYTYSDSTKRPRKYCPKKNKKFDVTGARIVTRDPTDVTCDPIRVTRDPQQGDEFHGPTSSQSSASSKTLRNDGAKMPHDTSQNQTTTPEAITGQNGPSSELQVDHPPGLSELDLFIIKALTKGLLPRDQICAALGRDRNYLYRCITRYIKNGYIARVTGLRGIYRINQLKTPDLGDPFTPAIPAPEDREDGYGPGKKYKYGIHKKWTRMRVLAPYLEHFQKQRLTYPVLNSGVKGWEWRYVPDADIGFYGWKKFYHPNFKIELTTTMFKFWPHAWGNTPEEALERYHQYTHELRDIIERSWNVKCTFEVSKPSHVVYMKDGKELNWYDPNNPWDNPKNYENQNGNGPASVMIHGGEIIADESGGHEPGLEIEWNDENPNNPNITALKQIQNDLESTLPGLNGRIQSNADSLDNLQSDILKKIGMSTQIQGAMADSIVEIKGEINSIKSEIHGLAESMRLLVSTLQKPQNGSPPPAGGESNGAIYV